jgi:hypothetical protein
MRTLRHYRPNQRRRGESMVPSVLPAEQLDSEESLVEDERDRLRYSLRFDNRTRRALCRVVIPVVVNSTGA